MSSPFDQGRDSATGGFGFESQPDVADEHIAAFDSFGRAVPADRLSESDYRPGDQKP